MDLQKYWNDVRRTQEGLPRQQVYYLISLDNPDKGTIAGRVIDMANPKEVARRIVERTHVLASAEDISRHEAEQAKQAEELAEIEFKRKGQLAMPKELQDLVRMAAEGQQPKKEKK